ncbi:MAG: hypothetical protein RLZZ522_1459, partial [Verrucomicrobiota bacterium]
MRAPVKCLLGRAAGLCLPPMKQILLLLVGAACLAEAEVAVTVGEVSDKRTTGKFFSGLELKLLLEGPELADVKGVRLKLGTATDDTGKKLVDSKRGSLDDDFEPLKEPFAMDAKKGMYEVALTLLNPVRTAKTVKVTAKIELMSPTADPASIVTASVAKTAGKPLDDATLKAAGVTLTLKAPKGDTFAYTLKDPKGRVASVEFCGADGKALEKTGRSS